MLSSLLSLMGLKTKTEAPKIVGHECPYCHVELVTQGQCEDHDNLGTYVAETHACPDCDYRLECNPVYVD